MRMGHWVEMDTVESTHGFLTYATCEIHYGGNIDEFKLGMNHHQFFFIGTYFNHDDKLLFCYCIWESSIHHHKEF
ncbi:hypothetical protein LguiB_012631 [Lonicera macranthoides]